jgi:anti-sigma factor RsiW
MTRDELEFRISQYLDGTLAAGERAALEDRLATDADARAVLDEYRRLETVLKAAPAPAIHWDRFAEQVCAAVADAEEEPAQTYRIGWVRTMASLALAAAVLIGIGFAIRLLRPDTTPRPGGGGTVARGTVDITVVDAVASASGTAPAAATTSPATSPDIEVAVGPAAATGGDQPAFAGFRDDVVSRPSQVIIARSGQAVRDGAFLP